VTRHYTQFSLPRLPCNTKGQRKIPSIQQFSLQGSNGNTLQTFTLDHFTFCLNLTFKLNLNLDPKICFQTDAEINFGLKAKLSLKPSINLSFEF